MSSSQEISLRIGYDAKRALNNMTGLGNYSRLAIRSIAERYTDSRLLLYAPAPRPNPRMKDILELPNVELKIKAGRMPGAVWRTWGITADLRRDRPQIYHGLSNELPLNIRSAGVKSVLTMHDLIYRRLPYCYKPADRFLYDFKYSRSCHAADRIIAVSRRTALDIVELYGVDPDKIDVVYQGCEDTFKLPATAEERIETLQRLGIPQGKFVLQVGSIERRKNLELTIRALSALPSGISLVVVGKGKGDYFNRCMELARELGVGPRIKLVEGASMRDLAVLNSEASAAAYPSRYEGFGIPVLEAATCGTPVVAATGSCLEEAGGEGAIYVNPDDAKGMAQALNSILSDAALRDSLAAEGLRHAAKFDNSDIAERLMAVYLRTLEQR